MKNANIYEEIGKTLAPVEIESPEAMADFGITKKDLVLYRIGGKSIMIYPYPAPEEVCREMLSELEQRYKRDNREQRCLVPGAYGRTKLCPDRNSCSACPYGREGREPSKISLEEFLEGGEDLENQITDVQSDVICGLFLDYLAQVNPRYASIVQLKMRNSSATAADISRELQLPYHVVRYALGEIRSLATLYFGREAVR